MGEGRKEEGVKGILLLKERKGREREERDEKEELRKGRTSRSEGAMVILLQAVAAPGGSYWGTDWAPWARWSGSQHWGAWVLRTVEGCTGNWCRMGYPLPQIGSGVSPVEHFWKFAFKILPSGGCHERQKLASVGVQNDIVKREKLVLHNRMKWGIACRSTAGAVAQALSAYPGAPPLAAGCKVSGDKRPCYWFTF